MFRLLGAIAVLLCFAPMAQARQHHAAAACHETGDIMRPVCGAPPAVRAASSGGFLEGVRSIRVTMHRERHARRAARPHQSAAAVEVVAHPAGCPARAFCGCGAAVRVFGHAVRDLWLASNWFRFPRSAPAPGMVAVRPHHVFVLEAYLGGDTWLAYDANSGRGLTRVHARSIAGYAIVNPHGAG